MSDLIVSYQMGKVASSSIAASIIHCEQFHSWSSEEPIMFFSSRNTGSLKGRILQYCVWRIRYMRLALRYKYTLKNNGRVKLIVGVREPVSRNVSGYFQSLMKKEKGVSVRECIERFNAYCPHLAPLTWFDVELKQKLGIDIYQYEFDKENGYARFSQGPFDIFVYRQEDLKDNVSALRDFLGDSQFTLESVNEAGSKWSSSLYKKFINEFCPSREYLQLMYRSKYFTHFYTHEHREKFEKSWRLVEEDV